MTPNDLHVLPADMELFARASGDVNPLHVSAEYARRTPFGEPVVYGVLAALAACAQLRERHGSAVESVALEFRGPLAVGMAYDIEIEDANSAARVHISDLGQALLEATIRFAEGRPRPTLPAGRAEGRAAPAALELASLEEGRTASGLWAPSLAETRELLERWGLPARGFDELAVAVLGWVSYLVGMELPGEQATFWKLDLRLAPAPELPSLPLTYRAQVVRRDQRIGLVELDAALGDRLATASISAFVREEPPTADLKTLASLVADTPELKGKVALVVGGSRGLGAAIGQALALRSAHVVLVYRDSATEARRVRDSLVGTSGSIEPIQGDAGNAQWCRATLRPLLEKRGGLDLLVCNASPPIRPLRFDPATLKRFAGFVHESVGLVAAPLAAFLTDLDARSGTALVVSSSALTTLPPEWPHYVTAKAAVEGLASWAAAAHPRVRLVVVRPPKLLTDQMNSLLGRVGAARVEPVAATIVGHLARPRSDAPVPELVELEA